MRLLFRLCLLVALLSLTAIIILGLMLYSGASASSKTVHVSDPVIGTVHPDPEDAYDAQRPPHLTPQQVKLPPIAAPARLVIPKIKVNAPIEQLDLLEDGSLDTPSKDTWADVGWYKRGPMPGQKGSAVIDGHLNQPGDDPAVFWNLHNLKRGDIIEVVDHKGNMYRFKVDKIASYPPDKAPVTQIFSNDSRSHLNLITCAGDWVPDQNQMNARLVVFSTKIES